MKITDRCNCGGNFEIDASSFAAQTGHSQWLKAHSECRQRPPGASEGDQGTKKTTRVNIRMGSVFLPDRHLSDDEQSVDAIDIPLNPGERVLQVDLEHMGNISYPPTSRALTKSSRPAPGLSNTRSKQWKYRAITVEDVIYTDSDLDDDNVIEDAEVVGDLAEGEDYG